MGPMRKNIENKKIVINDSQRVKKIKENFKRQGCEKIHILSDFDRTLTCAFVNKEKVPSIISILRSSDKYLGKNYAKAAHQLYDKYHPVEVDPEISFADKKKVMKEWWQAHFDLIKKSGLKKEHLDEITSSHKIKFRKGALEFFDLLHKHDIPLIIISSSGVGNYVITQHLKRNHRLYKNVHVVSNGFLWNQRGEIVDIKQPIIHCLNKDETVLNNFPFYSEIEKRKNVILLGDNIEDIAMLKGLDNQNLLKIGFLNENVEKQLEKYQQSYDLVALNDFSMEFVNEILNEII